MPEPSNNTPWRARDACIKRIAKFTGVTKPSLGMIEDEELALWAKQDDATIPKVMRGLAVRETVKDVLQLLRVMPSDNTKLSVLCALAVAEDGWEGDVNGVHIVCTPNRRKR